MPNDSVAVIPAGVVPANAAWRSLLWMVPLTLLWILAIYRQPVITASGVPTTAVRLMTYALIGIGLWLGLEGTSLTPIQRRTSWRAVMVPFTLWAAAVWSLGINGVFRTGSPPPPLPL